MQACACLVCIRYGQHGTPLHVHTGRTRRDGLTNQAAVYPSALATLTNLQHADSATAMCRCQHSAAGNAARCHAQDGRQFWASAPDGVSCHPSSAISGVTGAAARLPAVRAQADLGCEVSAMVGPFPSCCTTLAGAVFTLRTIIVCRALANPATALGGCSTPAHAVPWAWHDTHDVYDEILGAVTAWLQEHTIQGGARQRCPSLKRICVGSWVHGTWPAQLVLQ